MKATTREHQLCLLQMLKEIDRICKKNNIPYMLFAGTALGAVRHQGFIPWDDDLDIIMYRPAYKRFLEVAERELDQDTYFLQKEYSEHWPMFFSKLRKNNTACIERYIPKDSKVHQGVYVDIFPCDNLCDNIIMGKLQFLASKVVIAKALDKRGYLTDSKLKKVFMSCCRVLPSNIMGRFTRMESREKTKMLHCFFGAASKYQKSVFPREWLMNSVELKFEDGNYPVSAYYDSLMKVLYGDYMTPLPENKRGCKVHGDIVDLEHSYEEYVGIQETMTFTEYSRSIR